MDNFMPVFCSKAAFFSVLSWDTSKFSCYVILYCKIGFSCGLLFCCIADFFDWSLFKPLILSSDETNILNNDYNTIEMSEKNLKNQEEIKSVKKNLSVWLVVTTVCWCLLFYKAFTST
jgi:hypothetical protein